MKVVKITKKNGKADTYHIVVEMSTKELDVGMMGGVDWTAVAPVPPRTTTITDPGLATTAPWAVFLSEATPKYTTTV